MIEKVFCRTNRRLTLSTLSDISIQCINVPSHSKAIFPFTSTEQTLFANPILLTAWSTNPRLNQSGMSGLDVQIKLHFHREQALE